MWPRRGAGARNTAPTQLGDDILIDESGESGEEGFYFGDDKERSPYGGNDKIYGNDG